MALSPEQISAARDFADHIGHSLGIGDVVSLRTAIAAAGRMAGTFLFRSYSLALADAKAGTVLRASVAGESGAELIRLIAGALARMNISVDEQNVDISTGAEGLPGFLETQALLEPALTLIKEKYNIGYAESAQAAAVATAILIKVGEKHLAADSAFSIAVYGLIEGTKTVPRGLRD